MDTRGKNRNTTISSPRPMARCQNIFLIAPLAKEEMSFKDFCVMKSDGHFVQRSERISAILEEGYPRNISVNLF